jgi:hypothetical protein
LNAAVLLGLAYVWGRNQLDLRSKHSLGLVLFAILLDENLLGAYLFVIDPTVSAWVVDLGLVPPPGTDRDGRVPGAGVRRTRVPDLDHLGLTTACRRPDEDRRLAVLPDPTSHRRTPRTVEQ